ncbi:MAG: S8 family serine peptidase [Saprospiraceae bacterium]
MRRHLFVFVLWLAAIQPALAQQGLEKIDTALLRKIESGAAAEFLVILRVQANVRDATRFHQKADKGRYVYETLLETAERTQGPVREVLRQAGAPMQSFWIVNALWSKGRADLVLRLAEMPDVARVEDNPVLHLSRVPKLVETAAIDRITPNSNTWGLTKINVDDVWALGHTGTGVVVGGQDTGYEWEHPAIKDQYRGWDGSSADHNYNWHDAIHNLINGGSNSCGLNLDEPCDDNGHGTHTAGTMAGMVNSVAIGVAPNAKWIGCRNMEEGDGTPATYIECFEWLTVPTDLNDANPDPNMAPHVVNNSWGCPSSEGCNSGNFATMDTVINNMRAAGIVVVTSAGNDGPSCGTINNPPSIFAGSFAVGATNSSDNITAFSSRGPVTVFGNRIKPDISAPGEGIYSCLGTDNNPGSYNYASWSGTSMAGPHVAGVVALMLSARPDLIGQVTVLENLMKNTAVPRFSSSPHCGTDNASSRPNNKYGWGRVDALAAVNAAINLPVELVSFSAKMEDITTLLFWSTATEQGCDYFEIQRSSDAVQWQILGNKTCSASSSQITDYQFRDLAPAAGLNYYRLRQVDDSGAFAYSPIVSVRHGQPGVRLRVAAHPVRQQIFVEVIGSATGEQWRISLHGMDGREVLRSEPSEQILTVNLPGLVPGMYTVWLHDAQGRVVDVRKLVW